MTFMTKFVLKNVQFIESQKQAWASKKWVWVRKISEQLTTGLVEVEQVLERQIKKKSVLVDRDRGY